VFALVLATAGGAGLVPVAPGTAGSAVGVFLFLVLASLWTPLYFATVATVIALGVWAADRAERWYRRKDDGRIVIDEVAGQLIALTPLLWMGVTAVGIVTAFVAFRCLDIWKPGPVRIAEGSFAGGTGVVMDDVVAGLLAAGVTAGVLGGLTALCAGATRGAQAA